MSSNSFASIIGNSVCDKHRDYGKITEIREVTIDDNKVFVAILSSGKAMKLALVAKLFASQNKFIRRNSSGEFIVYAFTQDYAVSKQKFGPQRKRIVSPAVCGSVNNTASIGDEKINITSHISSGNPVYYNKQKMGER